MTEQIVVPRNSWFDVFIYLSAYRYTASDNPSLHKSDSSLSVSSKSIEHIQRSISRSHIYLRGCQNPWEFCSKPYCGALIPQSVNRHLDAGRLINFFIWQSSCCQLHTSVPARDKITFPIKMNTHASALLLGRFPPQCCGVVYCHVLKPLRLDVILTSFQTPFHMPRHSLGSRWPWTVQFAAQQMEVKEKETCMWPWRSMCCPCTVLSVLAGVLNVQHIGACSCWPTSCSIVSKQGLLFTAGRRCRRRSTCSSAGLQDQTLVWNLPMLVTLDIPACCPADLEVKKKKDLHVALAFHVLPSRLHCAERACWWPECATYWCL